MQKFVMFFRTVKFMQIFMYKEKTLNFWLKMPYLGIFTL